MAFVAHPFAYFLIFGYLLQTPDNSNFLRFPLKVRVIVSRLCAENLSVKSRTRSRFRYQI